MGIEEENKFDGLSIISQADESAFGPLFDEDLGLVSIFELNKELESMADFQEEKQ